MGQKFILQGGNKSKMTQVPVMEKVSFGTPFAGNSIDKTLTPAELVRALRFAIAAEYEAIQLYEQIAESTDYTLAGVTLMSIAREEKVHAGELLEVLKTLDPEEKITYEEGEEEIEDNVGKCRKLLKGGPGSGRTSEGGINQETRWKRVSELGKPERGKSYRIFESAPSISTGYSWAESEHKEGILFSGERDEELVGIGKGKISESTTI